MKWGIIFSSATVKLFSICHSDGCKNNVCKLLLSCTKLFFSFYYNVQGDRRTLKCYKFFAVYTEYPAQKNVVAVSLNLKKIVMNNAMHSE